MICFLADHNLTQSIVSGLWSNLPPIDVERALDVGLAEAADPDLLAWAAEQRRVLLTHDYATMPMYAYQRVQAGLPMAGVLQIPLKMPTRQALDEIILLATCGHEGECDGHVLYLPMK